MRLEEGLVGIADTRITTGSECITARKLSAYSGKRHAFFIMTSGLRSVRDKTLTYFDEAYNDMDPPWDRLFRVCNAFAAQLRLVAEEDRNHLEKSRLHFNTMALIGGQMEHDKEPRLYLVYPEGNWVEIGVGSPFAMIGNSTYGKPVLDRTLNFNDPMRFAFKVGCLAFDSTRISAADVDFPIDVAVLPKNSFRVIQRRYEKSDFADLSSWWDERLRNSVRQLPFAHMESIFQEIEPVELLRSS